MLVKRNSEFNIYASPQPTQSKILYAGNGLDNIIQNKIQQKINRSILNPNKIQQKINRFILNPIAETTEF